MTAKHFATAHSADFQVACDTAFQEYAYAVPMTTDPAVASAIAQRIAGAREFIAILLTLADPMPVPPARAPIGQLDSTA